jgi:hypothetical protein
MFETIALIMMFILGAFCGALLLSMFLIHKLTKDETKRFTPYKGKDER